MPMQIAAIALLTEDELVKLGPCFSRAYPIDQAPCFGELLAAIDDADRESRRAGDAATAQPPADLHRATSALA